MMKEFIHLFNPVSYFNLCREIWNSFLTPAIQEENPWSLRGVRIVLMVFLISLVFKIAGLLINQWVENSVGFDQKEPKQMSLFIIFLGGGIIAPILEELMFRLPNRFNALNISISTALIIGIFGFGNYINDLTNTIVFNQDAIALLKLSLKVAIAGITGLILYQILKKYADRILEMGKNKFVWSFYTYAILFGFAHITNFKISLTNLLFIIPLTLPQIFGGLFLGFTRINYGLKYSIFQHSLWNLLVSMAAVI